MANAQVTTRIDAELKEQADDVLRQLGMSSADYMRVAFSQLVLQQGIPFEMRIPNAETQEVLDAVKGEALRFSSVEDMMMHIDTMAEEGDSA